MSESIEIVKKASAKLYTLVTREISAQSTKRYMKDSLTLEEFDDWKNTELPKLLKSRHDETSQAWLTKDELVLLMDWKLAKGKYRPMLPKLIRSNDADLVKTCTQKGIQSFLELAHQLKEDGRKAISHLPQYQKGLRTSLKDLCELKGVGPATASLVLSLLHEITALAPPFFSDEAFMYYVLDAQRPGTKIKYNVKEYVEEYVPLCMKIFTADDDVTMNDIERGGWALKMYDINRITTLADIKIPFEVNGKNLVCFVDDIGMAADETGPEKSKREDIKREISDPKEEPKRKRPKS